MLFRSCPFYFRTRLFPDILLFGASVLESFQIKKIRKDFFEIFSEALSQIVHFSLISGVDRRFSFFSPLFFLCLGEGFPSAPNGVVGCKGAIE